MKKLACVLVVSMAMVGCGSSICEDLADLDQDFVEKTKDCPSFSDGTAEEPSDEDIQQCEEDLDSCSDSDKEALRDFIECVDKLPTCTAATEQTFSTSFGQCAFSLLGSVSSSCAAVSSESIGRKAASLNVSR